MITTRGEIPVEGLSKRERSQVAKHWNAVGKYLDTGNASALHTFTGVTLGGNRHELETRLDVIDDFANAHKFDVETIYEKSD